MATVGSSSIVSYGGAATSTFYPTVVHDPYINPLTEHQLKSCDFYARRMQEKLMAEANAGGDGGHVAQQRRGALFCRSGTWLEIVDDVSRGNAVASPIRGTQLENSRFSIVDFVSVAMGLVSIRGVQTQRFVCMDSQGKLYATPLSNYSAECVFLEEMMENYYNVYSSCSYGTRQRPWFMELRRSGKPRRGPNTRKRRKASHFLVVHYDSPPLRKPKPKEGEVGKSVDLSTLVVASLLHQPPSHPYFRPSSTPSTHRISRLTAKVVLQTQDPKETASHRRRKERPRSYREDRLRREERKRKERQQELRRMRLMEERRKNLRPDRNSTSSFQRRW
ncbi:unnamed protein product [Caenorhabditis auriculariae]|uniref:FGF n=1 Tax=Caenorhabditis auriculariae TaxID=2777116 RepID=A0A8S1GXN6_9PELO|nr:unnamed protein product [Caenorhabditis auriculariae]